MKKSSKFSPEVRERAVRMVQEHRGEYPSLWAAIDSIAPKIGCVPQTLLDWVKQVEIDSGTRPGVSTAEAQRIKDLEREVKELRRANEADPARGIAPRRLDLDHLCAESGQVPGGLVGDGDVDVRDDGVGELDLACEPPCA